MLCSNKIAFCWEYCHRGASLEYYIFYIVRINILCTDSIQFCLRQNRQQFPTKIKSIIDTAVFQHTLSQKMLFKSCPKFQIQFICIAKFIFTNDGSKRSCILDLGVRCKQLV